MSAQQKVAWFNLAIALIASLAYFILWPLLGPWRAMGAFGLLGISGCSPLFYLRGKKTDRVVLDERNQAIGLRAYSIAKSVIWVLLIGIFLVAMQIFGEDGAVPLEAIGMVLFWAFCLFLIIQSSATLVLHHQD